MKPEISKVLCISDPHCGAYNAIANHDIPLVNGGTYQPSQFQLAINSIFRECLEPISKQINGEKFCMILNGDMLEGRHHHNEDVLLPITNQEIVFGSVISQIFEFVKNEQLHKTWMVKGTAAHAGIGNEFESFLGEMYKADLKLVRDSRKILWNELYYQFPNGAVLEAEHHFNATAIYEQTAYERELKETVWDFWKSGKKSADILYRAHIHRHSYYPLSTHPRTKVGVFTTPGWQGKSEYVKKMLGGRIKPHTQMGMVLLDIEDDKVVIKDHIRTILESEGRVQSA